ncbi:uncharacterized protein LOC105205123 [Solenopsis invicta]|uniref:uncharacterized protein LOC105205123 n=1 Tax=Solenopsis invicta TaxID=13686 RepID=UPI00193DA25C|nr:uncharacterized protein LOC105205123 [Solenopsis invicta]
MPRCIVIGCTLGYKSNPDKKHFFCVPKNKDMQQQWQAAVRRKNVQLTQKHCVCENHFHPSNIVWQNILKDADRNIVGVGAKTQIPRLKPGTVPSIFPWTEFVNIADTHPSESAILVQVFASTATAEIAPDKNTSIDMSISNEAFGATMESMKAIDQSLEIMDTSKSERSEAVIDVPNVLDKTRLTLQSMEAIKFLETMDTSESEPVTNVPSVLDKARRLTLQDILHNTIRMPKAWQMANEIFDGVYVIGFYISNYYKDFRNTVSLQIEKEIILSEDNKGISAKINVIGHSVAAIGLFEEPITEIEHLEILLSQVDSMKICIGSTTSRHELQQIDHRYAYEDKLDKWRHNKCLLLLSDSKKACKYCIRLKRTLAKRILRTKQCEKKSQSIRLTHSLTEQKLLQRIRKLNAAAKKMKSRALHSFKKSKTQLAKKEAKFKKMYKTKTEELLMDQNIPDFSVLQ